MDSSTSDGTLRVSRFDQVSSILITMLLMVGCVFFGLLAAVWLRAGACGRDEAPIQYPAPDPREKTMAATDLSELDEPEGAELELHEIKTPTLTPQVVLELAASQIEFLDGLEFEPQSGRHRPGRRGTGDGGSYPGPGRPGDADIIPRWERWKIIWSAENRATYAKQLDYFGIELAVLGGPNGQRIDYVSGFSTSTPQRRSGVAQHEQRLYMTWRLGSELRLADDELLASAGIATAERITLQLYSPKIEAMLQMLERERSGGRDVRGIAQTVFGVRARPEGGYEYYVIDQFYRAFER